MLVILVVVQVPAVLLHARIHAQRTGIDLLDSQIKVFQLSIHLPLLLAILALYPNALHIRTAHDVVPSTVWVPRVGLWWRAIHRSLHGVGEHASDIVPDRACLGAHLAKGLLQVIENGRRGFGDFVRELLGELMGGLQDLLRWGERGCGGSEEER